MQMPDESNPEVLRVPPAGGQEWTPPVLKKSEVAQQTANTPNIFVDGVGSGNTA